MMAGNAMLVDEEKGLDKGTRQWERLVGESERLREDRAEWANQFNSCY
jgi:hypothetical protein